MSRFYAQSLKYLLIILVGFGGFWLVMKWTQIANWVTYNEAAGYYQVTARQFREPFRSLILSGTSESNKFWFLLPTSGVVFWIAGQWYAIPFLLWLGLSFWDITGLVNGYPILWLSSLIIWLVFMWRYRIDSRVSALLALIGLLTAVCLFSFNQPKPLAEKAAIWTYILLISTALGLFWESYLRKPLVSLKQFGWGMVNFFRSSPRIFYALIIQNPPNLDILNNHLSADPVQILIWKNARTALITGGLGWLIYKNIDNFFQYISFYRDLFPIETWEWFWLYTNRYLVFLYTVTFIVWILVQRKLKIYHKFLAAIFAVSLCYWGGMKIFDRTTGPLKVEVFVWSISPSKVTLWDEVTLEGRNFKDMPWRSQVLVAGVDHRILKWTDREIIFQAEPGKTKSGLLQVIDKNGRISNPVYLEVYDFFTKKKVQ